MRIGIISDIHSNIDAFRAVLREFDYRGVDKIICLGDIIGLGAHPDDCVQLLEELLSQDRILSIVRGNHEDYLLQDLPVHNHNDQNKPKLPQAILDLFLWNHSQVSGHSAAVLSQFPRQEIINVGKIKIFVSHYPINRTGDFMPFFMKPNLRECRRIFRYARANVYLYGHTHVRNLWVGRRGDFFINPGSVGCPIGTESASAGILHLKGRRITYEQLDIDYNIDRAISEMMSYNDEYPAISYTIDQFYHSLDNYHPGNTED
ncbi:metallophosphoesterase family protein [Candidatus Saccharibacteria bacterium]|nr:metallophosphoesterase family protein [Candidatus Saccharibacteria bacterium]